MPCTVRILVETFHLSDHLWYVPKPNISTGWEEPIGVGRQNNLGTWVEPPHAGSNYTEVCSSSNTKRLLDRQFGVHQNCWSTRKSTEKAPEKIFTSPTRCCFFTSWDQRFSLQSSFFNQPVVCGLLLFSKKHIVKWSCHLTQMPPKSRSVTCQP